MSNITFTYDTNEKKAKLSVDGKELDFQYFSCYSYKGEDDGISIELKPEANDGMVKMVRIIADELESLKEEHTAKAVANWLL